jgi:hypothetical protein
MLTSPTPFNWESRGARRKRDGVGSDGQGEDGRVGRIGLVIDGRHGQVGGQEGLAAVDRRLNFFLGDIEAQREIELKHDDRHATGAGGGHLAQPLHLAELTLEGRGYGGGHHIGAGAGIEREHLDGRIVDLRKRRNRQLRVSDDASQQNCSHQQRRSNRPQDEWARRTHGTLSSVSSEDGSLTLDWKTCELSTSF